MKDVGSIILLVFLPSFISYSDERLDMLELEISSRMKGLFSIVTRTIILIVPPSLTNLFCLLSKPFFISVRYTLAFLDYVPESCVDDKLFHKCIVLLIDCQVMSVAVKQGRKTKSVIWLMLSVFYFAGN